MTRIRSDMGQRQGGASRARGVSLVELMIALALSAFLLLGLAQVFAASRAAYQTAEALGRVQENGRVGLDFVSRDLRMSGHMGCAASQSRATQPSGSEPPFYSRLAGSRVTPETAPFLFRFDVPIEGYEYSANNTSPGATLNLTANPDPPAAAGGGAYSPNLPTELETPLFAGANDPVVGSDIVILRYFSAEAAVVTNALSPAASPLTINFTGAPGEFFSGGSPAVVSGSGIFAATDCNQITVFQPQAVPTNAASGSFNVAWPSALNLNAWGPTGSDTGVTDEVYADTGTRIHRGEVVVYYVGTTPRGPALFRMRFRANPGSATIIPLGAEELAEGVETLQIVFARDAQSDRPALPVTGFVPDGFSDIEQTAAGLTGGTPTPTADEIAARWRNVGRVRFGMLIRSVDYAASVNEGVATNYTVAGTIVTPPADGRMRQVYETAVMQRNQAFGN
jgi:type IV pilus assembly protein PilW